MTSIVNPQLDKLVELSQKYNTEHKNNHIDLERYTTLEELIFCLWERKIKTSNCGFGDKYDDILAPWVPQEDNDDNSQYGLETNNVYQSYVHADKIPNFLFFTLCLPTKHCNSYPINHGLYTKICDDSLDKFNIFWINMGKVPITGYDDLRSILKSKTLSPLELCCLLWECADYDIFNINLSVYDFLDSIKT